MEGTPKVKKRGSLSLGRHKKKHVSTLIQKGSGYPKVGALVANILDNNEDNKHLGIPKSPSVTICSDGGIACTPPHKKINLDDSVEYSPRFCDSINSPSFLLSQTLTSNSPEVGWKWGRPSVDDQIESSVITPDSAYAADSSLSSANSSNRDARNSMGRIRADSYTQRFSYEKQKEEQRRKLEIEMRRAEKLRADEMLKQRCAKLAEQLREAEKLRQKDIEIINEAPTQCQKQEAQLETKASISHLETDAEIAAIEDIFTNTNDTLDDFFNDSDADGLLLEATQQVESKLVKLTQKSPNEICTSEVRSDGVSNKNKDTGTYTGTQVLHAASSPERKEKRSSLYMKFLEDDSPDDWFLSLDDVILQATQQAKKPRNSFQRHNSMPTNTVTTLATGGAGVTHTRTAIASKTSGITSSTITGSAISSPKIKRHSSSHSFNSTSGATSTYRDHQPYSRE